MKRAIDRPGRLVVFTMLAGAIVLALVSWGTGAGGRPTVRRAPRLPAIAARAPKARNVLMILTESVRFDAVCVEHSPDCRLTPFTNRLAESRFPLLEMRSLASTTAN